MSKKIENTIKAILAITTLITGMAFADGKITALDIYSDSAEISFESTAGVTYQIQRTASISDAWTDAGAPVTAYSGATTVSVPASDDNHYYRVLQLAEVSFWYGGQTYPMSTLDTWGLGIDEDGNLLVAHLEGGPVSEHEPHRLKYLSAFERGSSDACRQQALVHVVVQHDAELVDVLLR